MNKNTNSNIIFYIRYIVTYNEEYIEAIVEGGTDDEPCQSERPETVTKDCGDRGEESYGVAGYQSRNSTITIGYIPKDEATNDAANEKGRLRCRREVGLVANPFELANKSENKVSNNM